MYCKNILHMRTSDCCALLSSGGSKFKFRSKHRLFRDFRDSPRPLPLKTVSRALPASCKMGTLVPWYLVPFPEVRRRGRAVDNPPHLEPRLKKEYLYSASRPSLVIGCTSSQTKFRVMLHNRPRP